MYARTGIEWAKFKIQHICIEVDCFWKAHILELYFSDSPFTAWGWLSMLTRLRRGLFLASCMDECWRKQSPFCAASTITPLNSYKNVKTVEFIFLACSLSLLINFEAHLLRLGVVGLRLKGLLAPIRANAAGARASLTIWGAEWITEGGSSSTTRSSTTSSSSTTKTTTATTISLVHSRVSF